jgi:hypothetical protein
MFSIYLTVTETGCVLYGLQGEAEETVEHRASSMIDCKPRGMTLKDTDLQYLRLKYP